VDRKTILDFGRLGNGHTVHELDAYLEKARVTDRNDVGQLLPSYFDGSLQGHVEIGFPHGGMGPLTGSSNLILNTTWWGTWSGPRGGATPGTYAVICYHRSGDGFRALGVAGPVEVE